MQSLAVQTSVWHHFTLDLISMHRVYPHLPITGISSRMIAANSKRALVLNDNISSRISTKTRLICRAEEVMNFVPKWLLTNLCENFAHLEVKIWPTWRSLLISIDNLFGNWNLLKTSQSSLLRAKSRIWGAHKIDENVSVWISAQATCVRRRKLQKSWNLGVGLVWLHRVGRKQGSINCNSERCNALKMFTSVNNWTFGEEEEMNWLPSSSMSKISAFVKI